VPKSTFGRKVGYALPPGGHPQLAAGFALSVASSSKNKEAAYFFIQWLNSEEISTKRVHCRTRCAIRFRDFRKTYPDTPPRLLEAVAGMTKDYLAALKAGSQTRPAHLSLIQNHK